MRCWFTSQHKDFATNIFSFTSLEDRMDEFNLIDSTCIFT